MCFHFSSSDDSTATLSNGFLYIDGGVEAFNYGNTKIVGYSKPVASRDYDTFSNKFTDQQLIRVDMRDSWDWRTNISQLSIPKSPNPTTGTSPLSYVRGALFQGRANDSNIYSFGGTTCLANKSFPGWTSQASDQYSLWSYDTSGQIWQQYDVSSSVPRRPNRGAFTGAPDLGLAFYLNGQIDGGSSLVTQHMGNSTEDLQGLIILNTYNQTARNVSATSLGNPRVAGGLQYIGGIGLNGVIIAIGGVENDGTSSSTVTNGSAVSDNRQHAYRTPS